MTAPRLTAALLTTLLVGCVPLVMRVYEPVDGASVDVGRCGWSNVSVPLLAQQGVEISAVFHSGSGLGLHALNVRVNTGYKVVFTASQLSVTSPQLPAAITPRFGTYTRGEFVAATEVEGPRIQTLSVMPVDANHPESIKLSLPPLLVNGQPVQAPPKELRLRTSAGLVGLCQ